MPQLHLQESDIICILRGTQRAVIYGPGPTPNETDFPVGSVAVVREAYMIVDEKVVYRADGGKKETGMTWEPSIFMRNHHARLKLLITKSRMLPLSELTDEDVHNLGHQTRASLYRSWDSALTKKNRPLLRSKYDPKVWLIEFSIDDSTT